MVDCEQTRAVFADLIDKPPLTDQLLSRPPFKFILDVVSAIVAKTGYLKEQFTKDELNPSRFTDKSTKMEFLDKLIEILKDDSLRAVKSAKIVAGKEPEQTNLLLRKIALSARSYKQESTKQTKRTSSSSKEKSSSKRDKSKEPKKSDGKERKSRTSTKSEEHNGKREHSKSKDKEKKDKRHKDGERKSTKEKKETEQLGKKSKTKEKDYNSNIVPMASESIIENPSKLTESSGNIDEGFGEAGITQDDSPTNIDDALSPVKTDDSGLSDLVESPRPPPAEEREKILRLATGAGRPQTSMGRPGTAASRPAPPKLKMKQLAAVEGPVPSTVELTAEIIKEMREEVGIDDFVVEEQDAADDDLEQMNEEAEVEGEHGGLVQKIMEKKAELEEGAFAEEPNLDDREFSREKSQVEALQKTLQVVTRTTYPLSRLLDFAQEDLESMIKEKEKWRNETRKNETALKDREATEVGDTNKLSNLLSQLDDEVRDVRATLTAVKARIAANNDKIRLLLSGI